MLDINLSGLNRIFDNLTGDVSEFSQWLRSSEFQSELREIMGENFEIIFDSDGGAIGSDWDGNDLVDTGALKESLTNPSRLKVQVSGDRIIFSSDESYAPYVNDRYKFYGVAPQTQNKIVDLIENYLPRRGKLQWT